MKITSFGKHTQLLFCSVTVQCSQYAYVMMTIKVSFYFMLDLYLRLWQCNICIFLWLWLFLRFCFVQLSSLWLLIMGCWLVNRKWQLWEIVHSFADNGEYVFFMWTWSEGNFRNTLFWKEENMGFIVHCAMDLVWDFVDMAYGIWYSHWTTVYKFGGIHWRQLC